MCVFELPLGMPLLRHYADTGGSPLYYGAVAANSLVIRGMSAVYNYDYIEVGACVVVVVVLAVWGGGGQQAFCWGSLATSGALTGVGRQQGFCVVGRLRL